MQRSPEPTPDLATDALRALATDGPLTFEELAERIGLDEADLRFDRVVDELLDGGDRVQPLSNDRLADTVTLLGRVCLTHRLTDAEVDSGLVEVDPDLTPLSVVADDSLPLARGGRITIRTGMTPLGTPTAHLQGPAGWLEGLRAGDLLGIRLADGVVTVDGVDDPRVDAAALDAFAAGAEAALDLHDGDDDARVELSDALWEALAADHDALQGALPPLSELADLAGCNRRNVMLARAGAEWPPPDEWRFGRTLGQAIHDLDDAGAEALQALRTARAAALDGTVDDAATTAAADAFGHPDAVEALLAEWPADTATAAVAEAVSVGGDVIPAGVAVVLADAAERAGNLAGVERYLAAALASDPSFPPALVRAAAVAEDRGDARTALRLLSQADAAEADATVARLRRALAPRRAGSRRVGRNDPCPCGSGRKFKRCCADADTRPLAERIEWLVFKLVRFIGAPEHLDVLRPIGRARIPDQGPGWVEDVRSDPLVLDLAAFDLGLLDAFLTRRGPLLPRDERELVEHWRTSRRSVYRVAGQRGDHLTLDDLRRGATLTARTFGAPPLERGIHLLARVLPAGGDQHAVFWAPTQLGWDVPPDADLLCDPAADPVDIAARLVVGRPRLRTTEGDPLVFCDLRCALPQTVPADDAVAALRDVDALRDDGERRFVEVVDVDGADRIRGTVTVGDGEVRIDTNAVVRADRLLGLVRAAIPGVEVTVDRRTPAWQSMDDQRRFGVPAVPHEPSAEERALLGQVVRQAEERWLDQPVPALGGLTPRQARDDPRQRPRLLQLLDEPAGAFDNDRLRHLLDL